MNELRQLEVKESLKKTDGYCPCMPKYLRNKDTKCPCKIYRETGECKCGLYT